MVLFAGQVGEASEASTRADEMRVQNEAMAADFGALEAELQLIQRQAYIEQQAREYRLGAPRESRPFWPTMPRRAAARVRSPPFTPG